MKRLNNILFRRAMEEGGLIVPPDGWYELGSTENPDLTIGTHAEGLHNYDNDVAVGPSAGVTPVTVSQYAGSIGLDTGSDAYAQLVVPACSCSLELDPIVSIVYKYYGSSNLTVGVASEDISDNLVQYFENLRLGINIQPGKHLMSARATAGILIASTGASSGQWFQLDFEPSDYGSFSITKLTGPELIHRDVGTAFLSGEFGFDVNLPGSVITPYFSQRTPVANEATSSLLAAVRITTRRSV